MLYKATRWAKFSLHQPHTNYYVTIQTLTTLDLEWNNIRAEGAQHLAHALQNNVVREVLSSSITLSTIMFQYRHWPRWTLIWTKSVLKEHNTWLMHYRATRYEKSSPYQSYIKYDVQYRHSPDWILSGTRSVMKEYNTWLMHYRATWWKKFPPN
jgi:hypothetical protein